MAECLNELEICSMSYERVSTSANFLLERTSHRPKIAIICGSGLGELVYQVHSFDAVQLGFTPLLSRV